MMMMMMQMHPSMKLNEWKEETFGFARRCLGPGLKGWLFFQQWSGRASDGDLSRTQGFGMFFFFWGGSQPASFDTATLVSRVETFEFYRAVLSCKHLWHLRWKLNMGLWKGNIQNLETIIFRFQRFKWGVDMVWKPRFSRRRPRKSKSPVGRRIGKWCHELNDPKAFIIRGGWGNSEYNWS